MLEEKKEAIFVKTFLDKVYYFLNKYRKNLIFKRLDPKPEDIVRLECVDISYAIIDIYCEEIKYQYFDLNKDKFIGKVFKCYRLFSKPNKDLPITECLKVFSLNAVNTVDINVGGCSSETANSSLAFVPKKVLPIKVISIPVLKSSNLGFSRISFIFSQKSLTLLSSSNL